MANSDLRWKGLVRPFELVIVLATVLFVLPSVEAKVALQKPPIRESTIDSSASGTFVADTSAKERAKRSTEKDDEESPDADDDFGVSDRRFKKAPRQFLGLRGKKVPSSFLGMRGRRADNRGLSEEDEEEFPFEDSYEESLSGFESPLFAPPGGHPFKRVPSAFLGMRGKKAPSGFLGMRGKKVPSAFLGMRGKKTPSSFLGMRGRRNPSDAVDLKSDFESYDDLEHVLQALRNTYANQAKF